MISWKYCDHEYFSVVLFFFFLQAEGSDELTSHDLSETSWSWTAVVI